MKKLIFTMTFLASIAAFSQTLELKIGSIDYDRVFAKAEIAQKNTKKLEADEKAILDAEQKARVDIEKKMGEFQASMGKLSEKARQEKEQALRKEIEGLQQQFNQKRENLLKDRERIVADLEAIIRVILNEIIEEMNLVAVFKSGAFAAISSKVIDVSDKVVERLNKAHPAKADTKKKDKSKK